MKHETLTVCLEADWNHVFARLADLRCWPDWAPEFCSDLRAEGVHWRARTPGGEDYLTLVADERTGVIDLFVGAEKDELALVPIRVVRQPRGSAVICSLLQPGTWDDRLYERYVHALAAGLRSLAAQTTGGELFGLPPASEPFFPSLVTERFYETWDFYSSRLGFRTVCESGTYVHLVHPGGAQLGLLRAELDGPPVELVSATSGRGFWLTLQVADADAEHERLSAAGVEIVERPEDKPWQHRQFVIRDPNGVLVAIAHRTGAPVEALSPLPAAS